MRQSRVFAIDGHQFSTLEEFFDVVSIVLIPDAEWGRNLDAFNDILRGGFGTPSDGFVFRWLNSEASRQKLGYSETVRQLEKRLANCHPSNRRIVAEELKTAKGEDGSTVFDWLVEIIRDHGDGGNQSEDGVVLELR